MSTHESEREKNRHRSHIDDATEAELGRKLAAVYSELLEQPVPERFKVLLDRMLEEEQHE